MAEFKPPLLKRRTIMTSKIARKRKIWGVVFTLPALVLVSTFLLSGIVRTFYYSFFNWNGITEKKARTLS